MEIPELIFCGDGNARYARIAIEADFTYGAQLPNTVYFDPDFVDQNWKKPDFATYILSLNKYRPNKLATVLDIENQEQLPEVLKWAKWARFYVETLIIIPKVQGIIKRLPTEVEEIPVRLAFSYPSGYGKAPWSMLYEIANWPNGIHILGGPPHGAYSIAQGMLPLPYRKPCLDLFLQGIDVRSVDGNMFMKMANRFNAFFDFEKQTPRGIWPTLKDFDGEKWGDGSDKADAPYEAFKRSCESIQAMWKGEPMPYKYNETQKRTLTQSLAKESG